MVLKEETIREVKYALEEAEILESGLNGYDPLRVQKNASRMSGIPIKWVKQVYSKDTNR
jgi:hypothetical protein